MTSRLTTALVCLTGGLAMLGGVGVANADTVDFTDDGTFVYPTEDELLGPEVCDEDELSYGEEYGKGSAFILEDLQDGLSYDGSYAPSRVPVRFHRSAPTPKSLHDKACC